MTPNISTSTFKTPYTCGKVNPQLLVNLCDMVSMVSTPIGTTQKNKTCHNTDWPAFRKKASQLRNKHSCGRNATVIRNFKKSTPQQIRFSDMRIRGDTIICIYLSWDGQDEKWVWEKITEVRTPLGTDVDFARDKTDRGMLSYTPQTTHSLTSLNIENVVLEFLGQLSFSVMYVKKAVDSQSNWLKSYKRILTESFVRKEHQRLATLRKFMAMFG